MALSQLTASSVSLDRRQWLAGAAGLVASLAVPGARAAAFPTRTVKLVSPFSAGGGTDIVARLLAQQMSRSLGQSVIVENRAGAEGAIGTQLVARAEPDGHTLLLGNFGTFAVLPHITKTPYDPLKDFVAISQTVNSATVLVISPKLNVKSVRELVDLAKSRPGKLNYGYSSSSPLAVMEMFRQKTGISMLGVPYKGSAPAMQALMAGEIDVMFGGALNTVPAVKQGVIRALATAGSKRTSLLPDLPTVAEAGVAGFAADSWNGVFAPAGTPADVVARLGGEISRAMSAQEVRTAISSEGGIAVGSSPAEFDAFYRSEHKRWGEVIDAARIRKNT